MELPVTHPILEPTCHASPTSVTRQRRRVQTRIENAEANSFFNLLTGPQLLEEVESLLPEHRERLFPPTETLSMFMTQALSADGRCQRQLTTRRSSA